MSGGEQDWWFGRRTPIEALVEIIVSAIGEGRALSLIRLGDGEGVVMDRPRADDVRVRGAFRFWFGEPQVDQATVEQVRGGLRLACESADVLGLPRRSQYERSPNYASVFQALEQWRLPRPGQHLADAAVHSYLQFGGGIGRILQDQPVVGVVSSRELAAGLRQHFGIGEVRSWLVRSEPAYPGAQAEPHWPTGFETVMAGLTVERPGQPFLVGAGPLGKIYCARIKQLGGVALDVGSLLDGWAGVDSRSRIARHRALFSMARARLAPGADMRRALQQACAETGILDPAF